MCSRSQGQKIPLEKWKVGASRCGQLHGGGLRSDPKGEALSGGWRVWGTLRWESKSSEGQIINFLFCMSWD